eukprot:TRINITY_DN10895_c0_g1_i2.p1 TRINITY_DN10895_c0_g1~~TRINITY_DN10895_c0_g1_i2.p1  ORF type:complete len:281 (-),score=41.40 TRINITY_DN10895_c0_g1_i2:2925-3767(-)
MDCNFRPSSLLTFTTSSRSRPSYLPTSIITSSRRNRPIPRKSLVIRSATGSKQNDSGNGFFMRPSKVFMEEEIGAEYGEGFETFRPDGLLKVDVDFLNDRMQETFLQRIRYAMKPDEAFGLIFSWDNVVADTRSLKLNAWRQLASEEGKDIAEDGDIQRSVLYAGADHVLRKVLCWENGERELERLKSRLSQLYYENLLKVLVPPTSNLLKMWVNCLNVHELWVFKGGWIIRMLIAYCTCGVNIPQVNLPYLWMFITLTSHSITQLMIVTAQFGSIKWMV